MRELVGSQAQDKRRSLEMVGLETFGSQEENIKLVSIFNVRNVHA